MFSSPSEGPDWVIDRAIAEFVWLATSFRNIRQVRSRILSVPLECAIPRAPAQQYRTSAARLPRRRIFDSGPQINCGNSVCFGHDRALPRTLPKVATVLLGSSEYAAEPFSDGGRFAFTRRPKLTERLREIRDPADSRLSSTTDNRSPHLDYWRCSRQ